MNILKIERISKIDLRDRIKKIRESDKPSDKKYSTFAELLEKALEEK